MEFKLISLSFCSLEFSLSFCSLELDHRLVGGPQCLLKCICNHFYLEFYTYFMTQKELKTCMETETILPPKMTEGVILLYLKTFWSSKREKNQANFNFEMNKILPCRIHHLPFWSIMLISIWIGDRFQKKPPLNYLMLFLTCPYAL